MTDYELEYYQRKLASWKALAKDLHSRLKVAEEAYNTAFQEGYDEALNRIEEEIALDEEQYGTGRLKHY